LLQVPLCAALFFNQHFYLRILWRNPCNCSFIESRDYIHRMAKDCVIIAQVLTALRLFVSHEIMREISTAYSPRLWTTYGWEDTKNRAEIDRESVAYLRLPKKRSFDFMPLRFRIADWTQVRCVVFYTGSPTLWIAICYQNEDFS
jgi:hypothetical protein